MLSLRCRETEIITLAVGNRHSAIGCRQKQRQKNLRPALSHPWAAGLAGSERLAYYKDVISLTCLPLSLPCLIADAAAVCCCRVLVLVSADCPIPSAYCLEKKKALKRGLVSRGKVEGTVQGRRRKAPERITATGQK